MTTTLDQASPALAKEYNLTQAGYRALVKGIETVNKLDPIVAKRPVAVKPRPQHIFFYDSVLRAAIIGENEDGSYVRAMIQADYALLLDQKVTLAFATDKAAIEKAKAVQAGDVRVRLQGGQYLIKGDNTVARLDAIPMPDAACVSTPVPTWLGVEVAGYDPKSLIAYIGKKVKSVHLAVYDDQLEQIWAKGHDDPYTFTAGMADRLVDRRPNLVLQSQVAFRFFGQKQTLRLGTVNGQYVLCATNAIDIKTDLVVIEQLEVVAA